MCSFILLLLAITELENLLITQKRTITELESYVGMQQKKLSLIKSYLDLYIRENKKATEDVVNYLNNPVIVFIFIKRLVYDLDHLFVTIKTGAELVPFLLMKHVNFSYPELEDLIGAAQGIDRLANVYKLDVKDLADGNLNNIAYTTPMTASDCYELSKALMSKDKNFNAGRDWMILAHQKYIAENVSYLFTELDIVKYLKKENNISGKTENALLSTEQIFNHNEEVTQRITRQKSYQKLKAYRTHLTNEIQELSKEVRDVQQLQLFIESEFDNLCQETIRESTTDKDEKELKNYEALCRGELVVPAKISKRLTCRYLTENHPFLKLAPFKVEMMYKNPDLILFHDVLSDGEIETIKHMARPLLTRAQVNDPETGYLAKASYRISKIAWIFDQNSDIMAQITRRVARMTGLSMELTSQNQVVNYGIGGHYEPHYDFTKKTEKSSSLSVNRIATVLFYMSDVAQGGATVFTELGVRLLPVKGTAAFWFNLHPSLEGNYAMRHAACPVLQGDKWVVSKFIYQEPQIFLKPCSLKYQEEGFIKEIPEPAPKNQY